MWRDQRSRRTIVTSHPTAGRRVGNDAVQLWRYNCNTDRIIKYWTLQWRPFLFFFCCPLPPPRPYCLMSSWTVGCRRETNDWPLNAAVSLAFQQKRSDVPRNKRDDSKICRLLLDGRPTTNLWASATAICSSNNERNMLSNGNVSIVNSTVNSRHFRPWNIHSTCTSFAVSIQQ